MPVMSGKPLTPSLSPSDGEREMFSWDVLPRVALSESLTRGYLHSAPLGQVGWTSWIKKLGRVDLAGAVGWGVWAEEGLAG